MNLSPKVIKTLNRVTRLIITGGSLGFMAWKLPGGLEWGKAVRMLEETARSAERVPVLVLLLLLMFLNWGLESFKWRFLVSKIEHLSFLTSLKAVLSGVTVCIFTPNRSGEFFGRAFSLRKADPVKGILLTVLGSFSQLIITVVAGSAALLFFYPYLADYWSLDQAWIHPAMAIGVIAALVLPLLVYFNLPALQWLPGARLLEKHPRLQEYFGLAGLLSRPELLSVLMLSLARYIVFSAQFFLVLGFFGIWLEWSTALCLIPVIYLALAAIPTVALSELGVRGSVTLFVLEVFAGASLPGQQSIAIVTASVALWIINLAIPALVGIPFVFSLKFFRN